MKHLTVKALLAIGVMTASVAASATQVYLIQDGLRSGGGTAYNLIFDGSDGSAASTATWDWDGTTLTQTGGFLQANQRIGSTPGPFASEILSDLVTGLVIDTGAGTTNATTYDCLEGGFGAGTGANSCGNYGLGGNNIDESTRTYNVGANASCDTIVTGGDDGAPGVHRGLWNDATCGDHTGRGALDMIQVLQVIGAGQDLVLANWNSDATVDMACVATTPAAGNPACLRAHWLRFSLVPVPAAVWLFGSAVGMLGFARRRAV